jgi:hypothetical protein
MNPNTIFNAQARKFADNATVLRRAARRRGPGCEPVLRALALDRQTLSTRAHLVHCASCRRAATALRENFEPAALGRRRLFILVVIVLLAAIAAPFALRALRDDPHLTPAHNARGGTAIVEPAATAANDVPSAG